MEKIASSFRDPAGFVFRKDGILQRQINDCYLPVFTKFIQEGLYQKLLEEHLIIPHQVIADNIIQPTEVFISYPYEWSFEQYKDAALTTLHIQQIALKYGMSLKDATPYNIQFYKGKPLLIDTLSFEPFAERPWVAYSQFCQMFLAPLALMSYTDPRLSCLMKNFINGIPLELCAQMLPTKAKFNIGLQLNIFLHAKSQQKYANNTTVNVKQLSMTQKQQQNILTGLIDCVKHLTLKAGKTEWGDYYAHTNYTQQSFEAKKQAVKRYIEQISPKTVWDLGGNTNVFSAMAIAAGAEVVSFDIDYLAVNKSYITAKNNQESKLLPLVMDLTNPSASIGWANEERTCLAARAQHVDCIMALALIHHLAISNNLPFEKIANYFASLSKYLIIEFVDKQDSQVQKLLFSREDIFKQYTQENFEQSFSVYFNLLNKQPLPSSLRTVYLMERKIPRN